MREFKFVEYPLAVPRMMFILVSHGSGSTHPGSPCSHCSRLPLPTYSYTRILEPGPSGLSES